MTRGGWVVLAGVVLGGPAGCQGPANPPPIVVGHVAALSGADRGGEHAAQGIRLALKQLTDHNLADALHGRSLQVRHTDTRGQTDAFEAEAVRLVGVNRAVALLGGTTAAEVAGLDRAHVPVLAAAGVRPVGGSDLVFAAGMRPVKQAAALARYAAEEMNLVDVLVLIDERRDEFIAVADGFARQFARLRQAQGKRGSAAPVRFGKDARWDELGQLIAKRKGLSAVVFAGRARDWVELRRARAVTVPLLFAGDDVDAAGLQPVGKEVIYVATAFAPDKDAPRGAAFIQKYREAFKEEPDVAAALGYECLQILADALKRVESPVVHPDKLRDALRDTKDVPGLAGPLTVTADQHVRRPLYVARYDGTTFAAQKRYEPDTLREARE